MGKLDITENEAKREFIKNFNLWVALYEKKLKKLGCTNDDNLAKILRDGVYELEEDFSVYQENSFYSSIFGRVIVNLFEDVLGLIADEMDEAYSKRTNSTLYCFIHSIFSEKWHVEYQKNML